METLCIYIAANGNLGINLQANSLRVMTMTLIVMVIASTCEGSCQQEGGGSAAPSSYSDQPNTLLIVSDILVFIDKHIICATLRSPR